MRIEIKCDGKNLEIKIIDVTVKEFIEILDHIISTRSEGKKQERSRETKDEIKDKFKEWLLKRGYKESTAEVYSSSVYRRSPYPPAMRLYKEFLEELKEQEVGMWCRFCNKVIHNDIVDHYIKEHPEDLEKDVVGLIEKNWEDSWFTLKTFAVCYDLDEEQCKRILDWLVDRGVLKRDGEKYKLKSGLDVLFDNEDFDLKKSLLESRRIIEGTLK